MKNFLFESIWLLSRKDQRALQVNFHPQKNLIVGRNHTGKSSLIKTIFVTLGTRPTGKLKAWDNDTISLLKFQINGDQYAVMHSSGFRALFKKDKLVIATSEYRDWLMAFSNAVGFNLVLADKEQQSVAAGPHCFFLPFYINQDGSWQGKWDTFVGLQQYKAPVASILEYFSGIKPPEYYELDSKKTKLERALEDLEREFRFLERARERLAKAIPLVGPKITPEAFEADIGRLAETVTSLNSQQETLRQRAVREKEVVSSIKLQIELAQDALQIYRGDVAYMSRDREKLICPTCNAEHEESFLEILGYAEDARVLSELVSKLQRDYASASETLRKSSQRQLELAKEYQSVSAVLEIRRGDLRLGDVIESMSAETAVQAFDAEAKPLKESIDNHISQIAHLNAELKKLTDKDRSASILREFRAAYADALNKLDLPPISPTGLRLTSRPDISGSAGPRSLLAYYSAIWKVCRGSYGAFRVPLVIDAPNQQGQDHINLPKVLKFIADDLPENAQIIVGAEMESGNNFDKRIELTEQYRLLREDQFEGVSSLMQPYADTMYEFLQKPTE